MLTNDQVQELISKSLPSIVDGFKEELRNKITWEVQSTAASVVKAEVEKWVKENIIPEIVSTLVESKDGFVKMVPAMVNAMESELVSAMLAEFKSNLSSSYSRKAIFKAMFD